MSRARQSVSLVICTCSFERWHDLTETIHSVRALSPAPDEVIIVVDHNADLKTRATAAFPDLIVAENRETRGLSGARNTGIATASSTLVVFLDDDAIIDPDWLSHIEPLCRQPNVLGAMGRIEPIWLGPRPRWFPDEFLWVVGCTYRGFPDSAAPVRNLLGCSMALRRDVLDKAGGFNARLGRSEKKLAWSCEETELCQRARSLHAGGDFVFEPAAVVQHKVPAKRLSPRYFLMRCYAEGRSKWQVSALATSKNALSTEWTYVLQTLPRGIARGLADALFRLDIGGPGRALAITAGFACAVAGFTVGKLGAMVEPAALAAPSKRQVRPS
ncbi:glycosyltransferase [Microbacteriaceae bacterium K1510]|nr:glycosyltransferase [Microbacteriaceae bacterium K1510]